MRLSPTINRIIEQPVRQSCERCGGYLDHDTCMDLNNSGYSTIRVLRCIQCGDMIDEVILRNRAASQGQPRFSAAA